MRSTSSAAPRLCAVALSEAVAFAQRPQGLRPLREFGFTALLLPEEVFRAARDDPAGPATWAGLKALAAALEAADLGLYLDLNLSAFPGDHPLVTAHPEAFTVRLGAGEGGVLDPRADGAPEGVARIRPSSTRGIEALAAWASSGVGQALASGVTGLRLADPGALPPDVWAAVLAVAPETPVLAGPIADRQEAVTLAGRGVDFLASSLGWWDGRASWLVEEYEALRTVAPLVADLRSASPAAVRRGLSLAAIAASGLIAAPPRGEDEAGALQSANRQLQELAAFDGELRGLTSPGAPVAVLARARGADLRAAAAVILALVNPDDAAEAVIRVEDVRGALPAPFSDYRPLLGSGEPFAALKPGEVRLLKAARAKPVVFRARPGKSAARAAADAPRVAVEAIAPAVDGGRFPVKRTVGEVVVVEADVFADGHEQLAAELVWRAADGEDWRVAPMTPLGNDRWRASFAPDRMGRYLFAVEAWLDLFGGFRRDFAKKLDAGVAQGVDVAEGLRLVQRARDRSDAPLRAELGQALAAIEAAPEADRAARVLAPELAALMQRANSRPFRVRSEPQPLDAERLGARFASWYELFPRSQTDDATRHGGFDDVIARLPAVRGMGFDVLYFPPIHPIGRKNRKGRNNSLTAGPDDPGSPYAIGAAEGGHDAVHPDLGGIEGFDRLVLAAREQGLELALDFAVQCAPDHPWLSEHPGWFDHRPDGSIKYAENPPKKYEDIVNVDFYKPDAVPDLWLALRDAVMFWVEHGVRLFRVDNPHTKPLPFWEWLIADVRSRHPDAVFLAEAFTRPKVMYRLAKIGFSQSYTYFTWRHTKAELTDYLTELTTTAPRDFFRPHFFVNTPDINPYFLQTSGRAGFLIRAALAATLSGLFGVYAGFELLESDPVPGKEEYKDSEKYEIRPRPARSPGDIVAEITRLNAIRKANPVLQTHLGIRFYNAFNDEVLYFGKAVADADGAVRGDMVLVAVSLDPRQAQSFDYEAPLWEWGLPDDGALEVEDLLTDARSTWRGKRQAATLTPDRPYALWRVQPSR